MSIIITTDIFGLCESTDKLALFLSKFSSKVELIDPYQGIRQNFKNEQQAYQAYIKNCGHDKYFELLTDSIKTIKPDLLIGFSAGASAVWRATALEGNSCKKAVCFYPSQIRNHLNIKPKISTHVIFPHKETSFDVNSISNAISDNKKVNCKITTFEHGFMNKLSGAYNTKAEEFGFNIIEDSLTGLSKN